jgi:hypothetical protein
MEIPLPEKPTMRFRTLIVLCPAITWGLASFVLGTRAVDVLCNGTDGPGPAFIDASCTDPLYANPIIDNRTDIQIDGFHVHHIRGQFLNTTIRFSVYLPRHDVFQRRFFQFVYPIASDLARESLVGFAAESGGYAVQVTGALGYRHEAAAAKLSRELAAEYYAVQETQINGYIYGGSGGSYQVSGALENTIDVWQGAVPYVQAIPTSIPLGQAIIAFATLVLENQTEAIKDAVRPGGSSDVYAGLTQGQSAVMDEVTKLGLPIRGWELLNYTWASGGLAGFFSGIKQIDPTYAPDFWSAPGYLGTEQSPLGDFFRNKRYQGELAIASSLADGSNHIYLQLETGAQIGQGFEYQIKLSNGTVLDAISGTYDPQSGSFTVISGVNTTLPAGSSLLYDNSWFLACHAYHRYQIPERHEGHFDPWDQYKDAQGAPIYPQRPVEVGPILTQPPGGGGTQTGKVYFKAIAVQSFLDVNAFPWNAHWYREQIQQQLGTDEPIYRLYYSDNSDHQEVGPNPNNNFAPWIATYFPTLWQALRDLADWQEKGIQPPPNTQYHVDVGRITIPYGASERQGIQPIVHLCVNGTSQVTEVTANTTVELRAVVEIPGDRGCIIRAEWDYEGESVWVNATLPTLASRVEVLGSYTYSKQGTYFPILRVASSRRCDAGERFAAPVNLDRVRVVVS